MRKLLAGAAVVAAGIASFSGATAAQSAATDGIEIIATDESAYPNVSAVVTAPPGPAGAGYTAGMFEVTEAGSPVHATVERVPTEDLEVMLLLDTSGSMAGAPLESEKSAAGEFLSLLPAEIRVGAVAYGSTPLLVAAPSTDHAATIAGIAPLTAATDTALYDAVIFASAQFTPEAERRAIVLLSDGEDNDSVATLDAGAAAVTGIPVHVIELVTERSDRSSLDRLAVSGGGAVSGSTDPAALSDLYRQAAGTVANQYRITYTSHASGPAELAVHVATPEGDLAGTTTVQLPAAPPVPPTTAASPTPTTTAPPATTPVIEVPNAASVARDSGGSKTRLLVGGGAFFVALLLVAGVVLSGDGGRRAVRTGLGLQRSVNGAGVTQLKDSATAGMDRYLERRGRAKSIAASLEAAGISLRPGEFVVLVLTGTAIGALAALTFFGTLGLLATIVIGPLVARTVLNQRASRRRSKFAEQLPDNIQLLTSSLKAGHGLLPALGTVAEEAPEPSRSELRRVLLEIRVGRDPSDALTALADRMASKDFEWVVGAIDINREIGGDLAQTLDNVAETIRERQRLARHVKALTAEGRLSAYVLTGIPVFLGLALAVINPGYIDPLFSGIGLVMVVAGAGMLLVGWLWMQRLIRVEL